MNTNLQSVEQDIVNLLKTIPGVKTCQGYGGELDSAKKLAIALPAILVWWDREVYQKEGQNSYIRRPEFHAMVVTKNATQENIRRTKGISLVDQVVEKLEDVVFELRDSEPIENSKSYFIAAVKFIW